MQATRLIAVRHGETDWNAIARIQGHTNIALNARGRWQAARLAEALAHEPLDAIYASDLARAFDTEGAVAASRGLVVRPQPLLRERAFGVFEGASFAEIEARWPADALRWRQRDPAFGAEGGETLVAFDERCIAIAARLAEAHLGGSILVVAHGGVLDCLYRAAARVDLQAPRSWQVGNASINRLLYSDGGFTLVGWSDDAHLNGSERDIADEPPPGADAVRAPGASTGGS